MNGREYFHESVVKDIVDILTDMKDFDEVQFINNANAKRSFKSITNATKDLILTFPVMVSTDIEPDNAIMIAKAQEKKMASLLHILFTAISVGNNEDVYDYVRKFHSNASSMDGSLDTYSDALDKLATTFGESYDQTLKIDKEVLNTVLEELKESNYILPDDIKETSLESYKVIPSYRTGQKDMIIQEAKRREFDPKYGDFATNAVTAKTIVDNPSGYSKREVARATTFWNSVEAAGGLGAVLDPDKHFINDFNYNRSGGYDSDKFTADNLRKQEEIRNDPNLTDAEKKAKIDELEKDLNKYLDNKRRDQQFQSDIHNPDRRNQAQIQLDKAKYMADMTKAHNAVVLNNEYKKANELQPTMMVVNFMKKADDGKAYINTAVIGIKCKIYPINSADIVNRLSGKLQDKSFLTNFVRATTNEIAFFRDFLFAVDNAKIDAKSYGRNATSNKLWKVLERRSTKSKFRRSLKMYNDATAISTLVMSENDNEYLKKMYSIDMLDVNKARKIMDSFNFMCIVICNQSTEVASFLYDTGDDTYEMLPFGGLEREASDNSYKKMVNLMAKVSR